MVEDMDADQSFTEVSGEIADDESAVIEAEGQK